MADPLQQHPDGAPRALRRAEPRLSIAIAGAGCALAVLGALAIGGDNAVDDVGAINRWPGVFLMALVTAAGYALLGILRTGPLATAGAVAAALGVPALMTFLTLSDGPEPYSANAILIVSTLAWAVTWAAGPGKHRLFFLGAALIGLWATVLELVESVFSAPFRVGTLSEGPFLDDGLDTGGGTGIFEESFVEGPDPTTIGAISLVFGVAYVLLGRRLDLQGRRGTATSFAFAAVPVLAVAVGTLAPELRQAGTGVLLVLIGAGLAAHGATVGRRGTTWLGAAAAALGVAVLLGDMSDDGTVIGMLYIAAGAAMVALAHAIGRASGEPDEMEPGPSRFTRTDGPAGGPPYQAPPSPYQQPPYQAPPPPYQQPPYQQPPYQQPPYPQQPPEPGAPPAPPPGAF